MILAIFIIVKIIISNFQLIKRIHKFDVKRFYMTF